MAEADLAHRHFMDRGWSTFRFRGQTYGFLIALIATLASTFLIFNNFQAAGGLLGASVILPLVALFVKGQINIGGRASTAERPSSVDEGNQENNS